MKRLIVLTILLFFSCDNDNESINKRIQIQGTIQVNTGYEITEDTRVVLLWHTSDREKKSQKRDFLYLYGEGEIDLNQNTFTIQLDEAPDHRAMMQGVIGVAFIVFTNNPYWNEGEVEFVDDNILGISPMQSIIYKTKHFYGPRDHWMSQFPRGYSVGQGQYRDDALDIYVEKKEHTVHVVVDDLDNIQFMNWN